MKKMTIGALSVWLLVLGMLGTSAFASNQPYFGLDLGYANFMSPKLVSRGVPPGVPGSVARTWHYPSQDGLSYGVLMGIKHHFKGPYSLATELNGQWFSTKIAQPWVNPGAAQGGRYTGYENLDSLLGLSLIPGYDISPQTTLFLRLSVGVAHYRSWVVGAGEDPGPNTKVLPRSYAHRGLYYGVGFGVSHAMSSHVRVGVEADHIWIQGFHGLDQRRETAPMTVATHPSINQVKVSMSFSF